MISEKPISTPIKIREAERERERVREMYLCVCYVKRGEGACAWWEEDKNFFLPRQMDPSEVVHALEKQKKKKPMFPKITRKYTMEQDFPRTERECVCEQEKQANKIKRPILNFFFSFSYRFMALTVGLCIFCCG